MAKKKKGKSKKKAKQNLVTAESEYSKAPHTFVFHRGTIGKNVLQLLLDTRRSMEPYTAANLRARKKNVLKDFVGVASPLGVTHFMIFTKTDTGNNMRIIKIPRGPTITFKVTQYVLAKDVVSSLKKPNMYASQFRHHPLLVLNNFSKDEPHLKLTATVLQNMFPSINVQKIHLNKIRRCVLFNYDPETKLIEFRHYGSTETVVVTALWSMHLLTVKAVDTMDAIHSIKLVPVGISRSVKKLLKSRVPDLSRYKDVSDFFVNAGQLSESEAEQDGPHNEVTVPQVMSSRGNMAAQKSAIRLVEIGPRMQLQLVKIEDGLCEGEILYHHFVQKTAMEVAEARSLRIQKMKAKEKRKKLQKSNVEAKNKQKEEHKEKSLEGIKKKSEQEPKTAQKDEDAVEEELDDDTEYYRQEVGEEPDPALFPKIKHPPRLPKRKGTEQSGAGLQTKRARMGGKPSGRPGTRPGRGGAPAGNGPKPGGRDSRHNNPGKRASFGKRPSMREKKGKFGDRDPPSRKGGRGGPPSKKGKVLGGKVVKKSKGKGRRK